MKIDQMASKQIATTLARHYDSLYYVEIASGHYIEFVPTQMLQELQIPQEGEDFFAIAAKNADKYVHPEDLGQILRIHDKEKILENLSRTGSYSVSCRLRIDGRSIHVRHIVMMCEDKEHLIFCMENIDDEVREK